MVLLGLAVRATLISGVTRLLALATWLRNHRYELPAAARSRTMTATDVQRVIFFQRPFGRPSTSYRVYGF